MLLFHCLLEFKFAEEKSEVILILFFCRHINWNYMKFTGIKMELHFPEFAFLHWFWATGESAGSKAAAILLWRFLKGTRSSCRPQWLLLICWYLTSLLWAAVEAAASQAPTRFPPSVSLSPQPVGRQLHNKK